MPSSLKFLPIGLCLMLTACSSSLPEEVAQAYNDLPDQIDFNFHVRPILSDRCYSCHGPDENARKAELRLDLEASAFAKLASDEGYAFVAGSPHRSVALDRMLSDDPELQMPPPESNLSLTQQEKAIIAKWIEQGAKWKDHWAFIPPQAPTLPELEDSNWKVANPIDQFIYKTLEQNQLQPNKPAEKERLLRRVYLDLIGLPPNITEIDAFLADDSPDAYEQVVDRLLASAANAERLALDWMDLSRYADSHGMHADGYRMMWPWRDWVIEGFKKNMPYDQFVSWQLAGDMMPNATKDQKLATAFNRNHPMTAEGGAIDEEFRLNYVFDRAETVATAFLGLTMNCARCHDHKFDPISQDEYYQFSAYFNHVKELGMTGDDGNYGPMLLLPEPETQEKIDKIKTSIQAKESALKETAEQLGKITDYIQKLPANFQTKHRVGYFPLDQLQQNGKQTIVDRNKNAVSPGLPKLVGGKFGKALQFTGVYDELSLKGMGLFEVHEQFSASLWINSNKEIKKGETQVLLGTAGDKNNFWRGWDFYLDDQNRLNARLIHSLPHNYLHVQSTETVVSNTWSQVAFTYNGSGKASGLRLYINGEEATTSSPYDRLYKSIYPITNGANLLDHNRGLRVAKSYRGFTGENGAFIGKLDDIQCFDSALSALEIAAIAGKSEVDHINANGGKYQQALQEYFLKQQRSYTSAQKDLRQLQSQQLALVNTIPEVMVTEEMPKPRPMFVYNRGAYDAPMHEVKANTPKTVLEFPEEFPKNRLGLAQWLFQPKHPLTARVTVNRYWQLIFGRGLVSTPQDFGVQGALPSHPELLDWLAIYLQENKWDIKALLKTIVLSNTYQQSSEASLELMEKDPNNLLLARGASYRLPAELIRDNALAASGLLVHKLGGESVRPYQPDGLWIEKGSFSYKLLRYKVTKGDSLYRRSLYTFVKRTSPHPFMTTFDAPNRDICIVQRENTNTPLQALVLLNDPQFVEASRALAERIQLEGGSQIQEQLGYAFRLVTGRNLKAKELSLFEELYQKQLKRFQENPPEAQQLLAVGEFKGDPTLDKSNTAALAVVTNTMFNHDEAYMKR